MVALVSI